MVGIVLRRASIPSVMVTSQSLDFSNPQCEGLADFWVHGISKRWPFHSKSHGCSGGPEVPKRMDMVSNTSYMLPNVHGRVSFGAWMLVFNGKNIATLTKALFG